MRIGLMWLGLESRSVFSSSCERIRSFGGDSLKNLTLFKGLDLHLSQVIATLEILLNRGEE